MRMMISMISDTVKVTVAWMLAVSMAVMIWITSASDVCAHEVPPTIGDMEVVDGQLTFSLEGNFESIVAGIDLDGLEDTEAAPEVEVYDRLRALEPEAFMAEVDASWPQGAVLPALAGFNIGVELGQLLCIAIAFIIVVTAMRTSEDGKVNKVAAIAYMAIAILVVPLAIIPISAMGPDVVEAFLPLLFMIAGLSGLCSASCAVERFDTYRHMVAMPASIGIALIGAYWVIERVFL